MKATLMCVVASSILILVFVGARAAQGPRAQGNPSDDDEKHKVLARVMEKKLRYSHRLMTSLAIEDFARLQDDARELKLIGEATLSKVSPNLDYVKYAMEFSSVTEELGRRARNHDLNGATLSFLRLTMNCVDCHKVVRDKNIFGRNR
ncbi:MAG: hypothetical protein ACHRXM_30400 [Isosphaerales bacterium]